MFTFIDRLFAKPFQKLPLQEKERILLGRVAFFSFSVTIFLSLVAILSSIIISQTQEKEQLPGGDFEMYVEGADYLISIDIQAHRQSVTSYESADQIEKAIPHLLRLLAVDPANESFRLQLGTAYLKSGLIKDALRELDYLKTNARSDSILIQALPRFGLALFHSGDITESRQFLQKVSEKYQTAESYCYRAQVEFAINPQDTLGKHYLRKSLTIDSTNLETLYQMARFYMNTPSDNNENLHIARNYLFKITALNPLHAKAHSRLGMIYYYLSEPELAIKSFKISLALNPYDYNTEYNLGEVYYTMRKNIEKALACYQKTIQLKPSHAQAHFRIGEIALKNGMNNEAIRHFELSRNQERGSESLLFQLAIAYERKNIYDQARTIYKTILEKDALNAVARQKLNQLELRQKR